MSPQRWRFFAMRLNGNGTETPLEPDLPLDDAQITKTLSGVDELSFTVPVEIPRLDSVFVPWSTAVFAEMDDVIRVGAIVVGVDRDGNQLKVSCDGFAGYLNNIPFNGDMALVGKDPLEIARIIWANVQGEDHGDIGMFVNVHSPKVSPIKLGGNPNVKDKEGNSGEPYRLNWYSTFNLEDTFNDIAAQGHFDYYEEHSWKADGSLLHQLHIRYGGLGRVRDDLRFVVGENVFTVPVVEQSGEQYADEIIVLGAGEGRTMVRGTWVHRSSRLRRPKVVTDKAIINKAAAVTAAGRESQKYRLDEDVKTVVVRDHPNAPLGSWDLGDTILLQGNGVGWAGDLSMPVRIISYTIDTEGGAATLTTTRAERKPA